MKFYIAENKKMPWGDYGEALCYGYLNEMTEDYIAQLDVPELERTGPYIPMLYIVNFTKLIAVEAIKNILCDGNIMGIKKVVEPLKKHIVEIEWKEWDLNSENPLFFPSSGEPEDYIWEGAHDEKIAKNMPIVFCLEIEKNCSLEQISDIDDSDNYAELVLVGEPSLDIFCPENRLYVIISERLKTVLETSGVDSLVFIEVEKR